mmetsp:Transcript_18294/g.25809  ORF Transcript_18294/g.25809 Transcript_18294/m.25809 type:complete len:259 (+) Transcript_18294:49-825(+)
MRRFKMSSKRVNSTSISKGSYSSKDYNANHSLCLKPNQFLSAVQNLGILSTLDPLTTSHNTPQNLKLAPSDLSRKKQPLDVKPCLFSNGALEGLRHCHGEFVAMIASELASGTCARSNRNKKSTKRKLTIDDDIENRTINVTPKDVEKCLQIMDWNDFIPRAECRSSENVGKSYKKSIDNISIEPKSVNESQSIDKSLSSEKLQHLNTSIDIKKAAKKEQKRKFKRAMKNSNASKDMLREQERLLAESVARAKAKHKK